MSGTGTTSAKFGRTTSSGRSVEEALFNDPIPIYEQVVEGECRFIYYGETDAGRLLAVIVTKRDDKLRVVPAYDLDAGQRRDYLMRRAQGE